jgi:hypothetical protein
LGICRNLQGELVPSAPKHLKNKGMWLILHNFVNLFLDRNKINHKLSLYSHFWNLTFSLSGNFDLWITCIFNMNVYPPTSIQNLFI